MPDEAHEHAGDGRGGRTADRTADIPALLKGQAHAAYWVIDSDGRGFRAGLWLGSEVQYGWRRSAAPQGQVRRRSTIDPFEAL